MLFPIDNTYILLPAIPIILDGSSHRASSLARMEENVPILPLNPRHPRALDAGNLAAPVPEEAVAT